MSAPRRERLLDLAADRACQALEAAEVAEFERLLAELPDADVESFERAAAAIHLAGTRPAPLPESLRARLVADGETIVAASRPAPGPRPLRSVPRHEEPRPSFWGWFGWVAAAAAIVAWIVYEDVDQPDYTVSGRAELVASAPSDLSVIAWGATEDPAAEGASGVVTWSTERQEGYMTIAGLEPNDPSTAQYQLWIFDATRTTENSVAGSGMIPVDGGVFDVVGDEVEVPIDPKLTIGEPTLFAITVEKPGGVTVSKQERIVLAAAVE